MNKNLRKAMISTICLLIVGIMSLTGVTYAWFSASNSAKVAEFEVTVADNVGGLQIAVTTVGASIENAAFAEGFVTYTPTVGNIWPVSTDATVTNDVPNFIFAKKNDLNPANLDVQSNASENYVAFAVHVKNTSTEDIVVDLKDSKIVASGANGILNAAYVGIVETGKNAAKMDVYSASADTYKGLSTTDVTDNVVTDWENAGTLVTSGTFANSTATYTIAAGETVSLNVYVWVEGQDAQATNDVAGMDFKVELVFADVNA